MSTTPAEVTVGHVLVSLVHALRHQSLKWVAVLMAFAVTAAVLARPNYLSASVGSIFIGLLSPLWLRKENTPS